MLEAVSHPVCPFLHRALLVADLHGVDVRVRYIDLFDRAPWFAEISPEGRMPVFLHDSTARYAIDEVLPFDAPAGVRAHGEALLERLKGVYTAGSEALAGALQQVFAALHALEHDPEVELQTRDLGVAEAALAPAFVLLSAHSQLWNDGRWQDLPRVRAWADALIRHPRVLATRHPAHRAELRRFIAGFDSAIGSP